MIKNIKVSYGKRWNPKTGTCYKQMITLNDKIAMEFNNFVEEEKKKVVNNFFYSENDLKLLSIEPLEMGINFTNLIVLNWFIYFYKKFYISSVKKDKDFERITINNTILNVI